MVEYGLYIRGVEVVIEIVVVLDWVGFVVI